MLLVKRVETHRLGKPLNPKGIQSLSPELTRPAERDESTLGRRPKTGSTLKGLNSPRDLNPAEMTGIIIVVGQSLEG